MHRSLVECFYSAWVERDWNTVASALTPDFRFRSPVDDFTGIETYRTKCWPTGEGSIRFTIQSYMEHGDAAFLIYQWESKRATIDPGRGRVIGLLGARLSHAGAACASSAESKAVVEALVGEVSF